MMKNLRLSKRANKKKMIKRLLDIPEDLRDHCLGQYFHMCKEKAATRFFEWRLQQKELYKVDGLRDIIWRARLSSHTKFDLEHIIY